MGSHILPTYIKVEIKIYLFNLDFKKLSKSLLRRIRSEMKFNEVSIFI